MIQRPPVGTLCFWCGALATHKCTRCDHYICSRPGCMAKSGKDYAVNKVASVTTMFSKLLRR